MKIGILTFHCAHNYGAVLQCYALQETLKTRGHNVEIIDYRPKSITENYKVLGNLAKYKGLNGAKNLAKDVLCLRRSFIRHQKFEYFIEKHLRISIPTKEGKIPDDYDIYIIGSDQVWNPYVTHGFDGVYFGAFLKKGKCISYAASMETSTLTEAQSKFFSKALRNFDAISVREFKLAELLQPLTTKTISVVLDPTLLANVSIWDKMVDHVKGKSYVLVYQVQEDPNTIRIANNIADQLGCNVVSLVSWVRCGYKKGRKQCASPSDFVNLIREAKCIVTTSFHGTAFSVIFNKPFYCVTLKDSWNSRSKSLMTQLDLESRIVKWDESPSFSDINYSSINYKLRRLRDKSLDFLEQNLH